MPDNQVDEIKNRLDLAEIIRNYMKLEKGGINFRGLCPFHHEKTPSFFVSPSRQLWRCFGCSMGGDMFTFIQEIEGVDFKEALKTLADKAGVPLRSYDPKIRSEKARLYEVCEKTCQFFEKQLVSSSLGREAGQYLLDRGISKDSIESFRIGFAPYTRSSLSEYLRAQGYSPTEIFKAGVAIQSSGGYYYDRFKSRIIFPISDLNGQVIGFGGRVFFAKNQTPDPKLAKYINTPQTALYDKSKVLYGLDKAKMEIRRQDSCVLVEGYTDVIMAHQAGTQNVAAVSGTSLTEQQLDIVHRYTENLLTLFDMDVAGDSATKRGIDLAQGKGFNIKVVTLPEGKDPAEIIHKSRKKWASSIKNPLSIGDFYFQTALSRFDKATPDGMRNISNVLLPMIKRIPSTIEQSFWVQKIATEFACKEDIVWQDLRAVDIPDARNTRKDATEKPQNNISTVREKSKSDALYERMALLAMKDKQCIEPMQKKYIRLFDQKSPAAAIFVKIYNQQGESISEQDFYTKLSNTERDYLNNLLFQEEIAPILQDSADLKDEFNACLVSLRRNALQAKLHALEQDMKRGEKDAMILKKFKEISTELAKL
jgi:DNA primase